MRKGVEVAVKVGSLVVGGTLAAVGIGYRMPEVTGIGIAITMYPVFNVESDNPRRYQRQSRA